MESVLWRSPDFQLHDFDSPTVPTELAWTTARCNRLLRPLSSKIALLRKSNGTKRNLGDEKESKSSPEPCYLSNGPRLNTITGKKRVLTPGSSLGVHGFHWDPSPRPRKKIKLTYSTKETIHSTKGEPAPIHVIQPEPGSRPSARFAASFVNIDQPLLPSIVARKYRSQDTNVNGHEKKILQPGPHSLNARSRELFRKYAKSDYPDSWKLFEGIHSGLETLLKATSKHLSGNKTGARSLFSTCIRKTPEYIALQERWCRAQDPDSAADVSSGIYEALGIVGARTMQGSNALQELVRAHGVDLVGSAVMDGLICFPVASRLVKLCLHLEAYDEGQHIVECMLSHKSFPEPTSRDDVLFSKELSILDQFAIITGRFGFLYRKLTTLFENGLLPIEWISSPDMIERWSGVIQCISEGNSDAQDAGVLLRTAILMSEGQPFTSMARHIHRLRICPGNISSDTSDGWSQADILNETGSFQTHLKCTSDHIEGETPKTGLRLLAALCALDFAQNLATGPNTASTPVLQDLALEAQQMIETQEFYAQSVEKSGSYADGPCLVLLAAGLGSSLAKMDETALQGCLGILERSQLSNQFHRKAASFLSVVASWRGQAVASDGFECMKDMVQELLKVSSSCCCLPKTRSLVETIATSAAMQYASMTSKPRHLSWALDTETRVNGMNVGLACQTPRRIPEGCLAKARLGFRWEEGICEWVSGTPGVPKPKPIIYRDVNNIVSDSEHEGKPTRGTLDSSPSRVRCSQEVSSLSTRYSWELRRKRTVSSYTTKTTGATFLGVEINRCSQAIGQDPQRDRQHTIEQNFKKRSDPQSMNDRPLRYPEKRAHLTLKLERLAQRNPERGRGNGALGKSNNCAGHRGHTARKNLVPRVVESVDSEDELSFG